MSTGSDAQAPLAGRVEAAVRDLHPGCFAVVMATGIISTGTYLLGPSWLSRALLAVAVAALIVLAVAPRPAASDGVTKGSRADPRSPDPLLDRREQARRSARAARAAAGARPQR